MPTIKRLMDVAIVGMVVVDLVLTGLFISRRRHPPRAGSPRQAVVVVPLQPSTPTASTAMADDQFLVLRAAPGAGDAHELFTCPATSKWDYGGGTGTAQSWANWNSTTPTTSPTTSDALFMLLRAPNPPGAQPYTTPSSNAQKWDYSGVANASQNWVNWANTIVSPGFKLSTSLSNSATGSDLPASKP